MWGLQYDWGCTQASSRKPNGEEGDPDLCVKATVVHRHAQEGEGK